MKKSAPVSDAAKRDRLVAIVVVVVLVSLVAALGWLASHLYSQLTRESALAPAAEAPDATEQVEDTEASRRAENQPIRDEINRSVLLTGAALDRRHPDAQGRETEIYLALKLVNTSNEEVIGWSGTLYFLDPTTADDLP